MRQLGTPAQISFMAVNEIEPHGLPVVPKSSVAFADV